MKILNHIDILTRNVMRKLILKIGSNKQIISYWRKQGAVIGENCTIYGNVNFGSEPFLIRVGDNVKITSNVNFITHDGGVHTIRILYGEKELDNFGEIVIGDNVFIGYNVIIMPGVRVGDNVVIGAGSIVTKNLPSNGVYGGNPARKLKDLDEYYKSKMANADFVKKIDKENKESYLINKYRTKD